MVRMISFFICFCVLLHWSGPGIGSSSISTVKPTSSFSDYKISPDPNATRSPASSDNVTEVSDNKTSPDPNATSTPASSDNASNVAPRSTTTALPSSIPTLETKITSPTTKQSHNIYSPTHPASSTTPATSAKAPDEKRYLWILLPVLCIVVASMIYLKFKCKKVQHRPEMADNGTEKSRSASFQRTDSNKDGVMLLGVSKTSVGEDNAAAR
ncbi:podocalyxin-like isoform X2 [Pseudorasbora parva]|uniref:podocalyxin-like isoform X2 n=1 Tax=Pseudorasbora parva TaxID=51549 RepID=UPI00351EB52B